MAKKAVCRFVMVIMIMGMLGTMLIFADGEMGEEYFGEAVSVASVKELGLQLKSKSALLMDANTGNVLFDFNAHERLPIASVTKIMSMLLVMEAIDNGKLSWEEEVMASEHACSMGGTQVWLEPGESFCVKELLKATAVKSANDATVALGEKIAGSEEAFVMQMNERASQLGMKDTHFLDCTGLTDEGHYSSAYDIALMSQELIQNHPMITKFSTLWLENFREGVPNKEPVMLNNTNKLIHYYEGANGLKTGFTNAAGFCLSATAKRNNLQLIGVVLGEPDSNTRFSDARKILNYGFANYEVKKLGSAGDFAKVVSVAKGVVRNINAVYAKDVLVLARKGNKENYTIEYKVEDIVLAPVQKGQILGEAIIISEGQEISRLNIVAESEVLKSTFVKILGRMSRVWFSLGRA